MKDKTFNTNSLSLLNLYRVYMNPYSATVFALKMKMSSDLYVCCIYSNALQTRSYHGSNRYEQALAPGGYSDICIRRLRSFVWVQNSDFQQKKGWEEVSEKVNIFGDIKILWIVLLGHHKIGLLLGVISMYFGVFS